MTCIFGMSHWVEGIWCHRVTGYHDCCNKHAVTMYACMQTVLFSGVVWCMYRTTCTDTCSGVVYIIPYDIMLHTHNYAWTPVTETIAIVEEPIESDIMATGITIKHDSECLAVSAWELSSLPSPIQIQFFFHFSACNIEKLEYRAENEASMMRIQYCINLLCSMIHVVACLHQIMLNRVHTWLMYLNQPPISPWYH